MKEHSKATTPIHSEDMRALGSLERWFWLMGQNRLNHFAIAAEIQGTISSQQWRDGATTLQKRHPLLKVSVRVDENGIAHFHRSSESDIPVTLRSWITSTQWQEEMKRELGAPFDTARAPLARLTVLQGSQQSILILTLHHSIADGISSLFLLKDLLTAIAEIPLDTLALPASQGDLIYALNLQLPPGKNIVPPVPSVYRDEKDAQLHIETTELTSEETHTLLTRSRAEQTTLHGAIVAALVLAGRSISDAWNTSTVRIFSPMNIRKLLQVEDDCVVTLGVGLSSLDPATEDDLWELARSTRNQLRSCQPPEVIASTLQVFDDFTADSASVETVAGLTAQFLGFELMVSNLQALPFSNQIGHLSIQRVWGPASVPMSFVGEQDIGVVTVNGALCLLHASYAPLRGLLKRAVLLLKSSI